jgi:DNA-binding transcriptional ArsR family regulator
VGSGGYILPLWKLARLERKGSGVTAAIENQRLDETFGALANSTRRAILARLATGPATVNELADPFEMTLPAISKHIKVLERAGLVTRGRRAQCRPCALEAKAVQEVSTWAEQYRPIWEARFDQMESYMAEIQARQTTRDRHD